MGLETEYGLLLDPAAAMVRCYDVTRALVDAHRGPGRSGFLANGARLYSDCGHVEYATPECTDPLSVLVCDRAGELVVSALGASAAGVLTGMGVESVRQLKHNVDSAGTTFGCHENYQVTSSVSRGHLAAHLAAFLLTRCTWAGAGRVVDGRFRTSQRAGALQRESGYNSTVDRPLMNLRDEALADPFKWQRVHLLAGDANMAEVAAFTKLAATHLVLRCIEADEVPARALQPSGVAETHVAVAEDLGGRAPVRWRDGTVCSPLEVQLDWLGRAAKLLDRDGGEDWEWEGLSRWRAMVEGLEAGGPDALVGTADWASKLDVLDRVAARSPGGWGSARVRYADMVWHDLDPDVGLARRLEAAGGLERLTDDTAVAAAVVGPPTTGRAVARARFVELTEAVPVPVGVNWERMWVAGCEPLVLRDPTEDSVDRVERWLAEALASLDEGAGGDALPPGAGAATVPGGPPPSSQGPGSVS